MGCERNHNEQSAVSKLWYVGVILSIVGSICTNMGVNMQKYSFMSEAKRSIKMKRGYFRQPLWVLGLALVVGGSGLDFVALGFLPQSLATPVGGSTMVANVVFASLFLKEKFSRMDAMGTALVLIGICIVAAFAEKESGCYTVSELVSLYSEPLFVMYIVVMALSCIGLYALAKKMEQLLRDFGSSSARYKRFARLHPLCYPALSGVFGAQSILFAKSVAELVKTSAEGTNQFVNFGTYAISLSMFACIFLQIHWLAHGLQSFDAVFIVPVFQCFFISVSIFGGGVYFKEFAKMTALALGMFFFGASVTLSGVYLLSRREMNVLRPSGKFRAAVKMIIFIKRTQKACNIEHRWVLPLRLLNCAPPTEPSPTAKMIKAPGAAPKAASFRISKASVMPVDTSSTRTPFASTDSCPKIELDCLMRDDDPNLKTALDSSSSQIEIPPKKSDGGGGSKSKSNGK